MVDRKRITSQPRRASHDRFRITLNPTFRIWILSLFFFFPLRAHISTVNLMVPTISTGSLEAFTAVSLDGFNWFWWIFSFSVAKFAFTQEKAAPESISKEHGIRKFLLISLARILHISVLLLIGLSGRSIDLTALILGFGLNLQSFPPPPWIEVELFDGLVLVGLFTGFSSWWEMVSLAVEILIFDCKFGSRTGCLFCLVSVLVLSDKRNSFFFPWLINLLPKRSIVPVRSVLVCP